MSTAHVLRWNTPEFGKNLYLGVDESGSLYHHTDHDDQAAIRAIAARFPNTTVVCDASLRTAATALGLQVAPLPPVLEKRAALVALALAGRNFHRVAGDLQELSFYLQAASQLLHCAIWDRAQPDLLLSLRLRGQVGGEPLAIDGEVQVHTVGGEAINVYPVDLLRALAVVQDPSIEDPSMGLALDMLTVKFAAEPLWAVQAIDAAYKLPAIPFAVCRYWNRLVMPSRSEMQVLAAVMGAVAAYSAMPEGATIRLPFSDGSIVEASVKGLDKQSN